MAKGAIATEREMDLHLQRLGFKSKESYFKWCSTLGYRCTYEKTLKEMSKERKYVESVKAQEVLRSHKKSTKGVVGYLKDIHEGFEISGVHGILRDVGEFFKKLSDEGKQDFIDFFTFIEKKSKIIRDEKDYEVILKIFSYRDWFIRDWRSWAPKSHNKSKQVSSIVRYLFTQYDIPKFMDSAWVSSSPGDKFIDWFFEMGNGTNIRKCKDLPFPLTKKMAHAFLQAPDYCSIPEAFNWSRVITLGGDERLFKALGESRIYGWKDHHFIEGVIRFFVDNPMLDRVHVGPIVDYIDQQKYRHRDVVVDGVLTRVGAEQPNFSMTGRSPEALLNQVDRWHNQLGKERKGNSLTWVKSPYPDFELTEGQEHTPSFRRWQIRELMSSSELRADGRAMRHCVASYAHSCAKRSTSIWSLTLTSVKGHENMTTVEVDLRNRMIVQARKRNNERPTKKEWDILSRWALKNNIGFSSYVR
jgi:hypothetical protein